MNILGFDTSSGKCSVALYNNYQLLAATYAEHISAQAEMLVPLIEETLLRASLKYQELTHIAVTNGPGSFTGIRIGLAAACGIVTAINIKPLIFNNFELIHFRTKEQVSSCNIVVSVINAYREQLYYKIYNENKDNTINLHSMSPLLISIEECVHKIRNIDGIVAVSGSGLEYLYDKIALPNVIMLPRFSSPDARTLCRLAYSKITAKEEISSKIEPLYIRQPDAKLPMCKTQ